MTPEQTEALTELIATMDRRLSSFGERFVNVEANMAESASAADRTAANVQKLSELYVSIDSGLSDLKTVMQNYVNAVREQSRQARLVEEAARGLTSEVRRRLPEVVGG
jgi:hypothetical protein